MAFALAQFENQRRNVRRGVWYARPYRAIDVLFSWAVFPPGLRPGTLYGLRPTNLWMYGGLPRGRQEYIRAPFLDPAPPMCRTSPADIAQNRWARVGCAVYGHSDLVIGRATQYCAMRG